MRAEGWHDPPCRSTKVQVCSSVGSSWVMPWTRPRLHNGMGRATLLLLLFDAVPKSQWPNNIYAHGLRHMYSMQPPSKKRLLSGLWQSLLAKSVDAASYSSSSNWRETASRVRPMRGPQRIHGHDTYKLSRRTYASNGPHVFAPPGQLQPQLMGPNAGFPRSAGCKQSLVPYGPCPFWQF